MTEEGALGPREQAVSPVHPRGKRRERRQSGAQLWVHSSQRTCHSYTWWAGGQAPEAREYLHLRMVGYPCFPQPSNLRCIKYQGYIMSVIISSKPGHTLLSWCSDFWMQISRPKCHYWPLHTKRSRAKPDPDWEERRPLALALKTCRSLEERVSGVGAQSFHMA